MKYAILILAIALSVACSKDKDKSDKGKGKLDDAGSATEKTTDATDTSMCKGAALNSNIFSKKWLRVSKIESQNITIIQQISFTANSAAVHVLCQQNELSVEVSAQARANVTGNTIEILSEDDQSQSISAGDQTLTCSATLSPVGIINYGFQGPCLSMTDGVETYLFPPAL